MAKFSPPDQFDFRSPESWLSWKQRFTRFRTISKLDTDSEERQVSTLLYTMGPRAESVKDQLTFDSDADSMKWSKVVEKVDEYFQPSLNVIHQRCLFEQCTQLPGQTVEEFLTNLHATAKHCKFTKPEERIRDRSSRICGTGLSPKNSQLRDHARLTLADAVALARQTDQE